MAQHTGTVSWFNNAKRYGFLSREDGPPDARGGAAGFVMVLCS
ncbi:cold shock domain-containing protein [Edaphobacter sp. HDX4]